MVKKCFILFLICALSNYFLGCLSQEKVTISGEKVKEQSTEKIVSVVTTSG